MKKRHFPQKVKCDQCDEGELVFAKDDAPDEVHGASEAHKYYSCTVCDEYTSMTIWDFWQYFPGSLSKAYDQELSDEYDAWLAAKHNTKPKVKKAPKVKKVKKLEPIDPERDEFFVEAKKDFKESGLTGWEYTEKLLDARMLREDIKLEQKELF